MSFIKRLRDAVDKELQYWDARKPPKENLPRATFVRYLKLLPDDIKPEWASRKSESGVHGHDGEDQVFSFTAEVSSLGKTVKIYVKGFFFTKTETVGVEIQSCRKVN